MGAPKWVALGLSPVAGLKSKRGICPSPACKVISGLPTFWISTFSKCTFTKFTCFCKISKAACCWLPLPTVYFCLTNYPKTMWLGITILVCSQYLGSAILQLSWGVYLWSHGLSWCRGWVYFHARFSLPKHGLSESLSFSVVSHSPAALCMAWASHSMMVEGWTCLYLPADFQCRPGRKQKLPALLWPELVQYHFQNILLDKSQGSPYSLPRFKNVNK